MYGQLYLHDVGPLLQEHCDIPLVSISDSQRGPFSDANWRGTVYHGLPRTYHPFEPMAGKYLAFLGRISPEKRLDRAIEIARRTGVPLKVAAKTYEEDRTYFHERIEPLLRQNVGLVEFIGEVCGDEKNRFLGAARALRFPIDWPEPFGLVMIEALACGTPVVAWRNGSVPKIIDDGRTGFVVSSIDEAVSAVNRIDEIARITCRRTFEERVGADEETDSAR